MLHKSFVCRPEIGPKHFNTLKPEPGPTYNSAQHNAVFSSMRLHGHRKGDARGQNSWFLKFFY